VRNALIALSAIAPVLLAAGGETLRILIAGGDLDTPIEIADSVVARFHVWDGPGTSTDAPQGMNVDWSRGTASPPKGVPVYNVSFVTARQNPSAYVVRYAIDPATNHGYVYIPGRGEPEFRDNTWLIYRRLEGHWFHAWSEWEKFANPLIAGAKKAH
jgi:hypothetical protein